MLHERLQADVVREDRLRSLAHAAVRSGARVSSAGVELREEETRLTAAGVADDEAGEGESLADEVLWLLVMRVERGLNGGIAHSRIFSGLLEQ